MASNEEWGALAEVDQELANLWDSYDPLPEPEQNPAFDSFCTGKRITAQNLMRIPTKMYGGDTLVYGYDEGLKYRRISDGRRWASSGAEFNRCKIVRGTPSFVGSVREDSVSLCLVSESETDAARLIALYSQCDVAILPAGAKHVSSAMIKQLEAYDGVFVATDNDEAGEAGARKILDAVPRSLRFQPPNDFKDWCETPDDQAPDLPSLDDLPKPLAYMVSVREYLDLEVPETASWFENALLPYGGFAIVHGWAKNFKSFLAVDVLASLAQGIPWAGFSFDASTPPARVAVLQYEIPPAYFRERVNLMVSQAVEPELFLDNFHIISPLSRPKLRAQDKDEKARLLSNLEENEIDVLLVDPIRRAAGGLDLNSEQEVRQMLQLFEDLQDHGLTVIATHHDNKEGSKSGSGDPRNMTGSGAWAGDPDSIISVSLPYGVEMNDPRRNLDFTLRNAPAPDGMGFHFTKDEGQFIYTPNQWDAGDATEEKTKVAYETSDDQPNFPEI